MSTATAIELAAGQAPRVLGGREGPAWIRAVAACVALLPFRCLRALGASLGAVAGGLLRIRRRHVEQSLRAAGVAEPGRVARAMYASLGTGLCELLWLAGRSPEALDERYRLAPGASERFDRAAARGGGVIIATAHLGNWDLAACATARWRARAPGGASTISVVTKRLSWRALDRTWQRLRAARGVELIEARGALAAARRALAAGGAVAMLVDQVPERSSGVAVFPFLGAPARHDLGPALLSARTGAPIVVAVSHRTPAGEHMLDVVDVLEPPARAEVVPATMRIAQALETAIRAHPEQWLWLHRRWRLAARKSPPPPARARARRACPP